MNKTMREFPNDMTTLHEDGPPSILVDPPEADLTVAEPPPTNAVTQGAGRNLPVDGIESPTVLDFTTLEQNKRLTIETTKPRTPTANRTYVIPPAPEKKTSRWIKVMMLVVTIVIASAIFFILWGIHSAQQQQINDLQKQLTTIQKASVPDLAPAVAALTTPTVPAETAEAPTTYVVQKGDPGLDKLGEQHGCTPTVIRNLNSKTVCRKNQGLLKAGKIKTCWENLGVGWTINVAPCDSSK